VNRRSASLRARDLHRWTLGAVVLALAVVALVAPLGATAHAQSGDEVPPPSIDVPVDTANPFIPEDRDLTECIGMLQRPGCGSEARGGWHQNAVAIAMIAGLAVVFGRVAYGVRKNRRSSDLPG
jgi:hypothetical protein